MMKNLKVLVILSIVAFYLVWFGPCVHYEKRREMDEPHLQDEKRREIEPYLHNVTNRETNQTIQGSTDLHLDEEMKRRADHVQRICERYRISKNTNDSYTLFNKLWSQKVMRGRFLISDKVNASYCIIYKAGCTTWHDVFARLEFERSVYERNKNSLWRTVGRMRAKNNAMLFDKILKKNYFNFMMVRHPFTRLLSAYRDRILDGCTGQSKRWIPKIMKSFRKRIPKLNRKGCLTEFPSFSEFVQFVVRNPTVADHHWVSQSIYCAPCALRYDAIAKLESSTEESNYIMKKVGMDRYIELQPRHVSKVKTENLIEKYYSNITCKELDGLITNYRLDFEMFEYDYESYWDYCKRQ